MYTFCQGPGPLYLRAFALRGTMYTLISNIDEAIQDLTQVIDAESLEDLTKVLLQLPYVNLLAFCQESFTLTANHPVSNTQYSGTTKSLASNQIFKKVANFLAFPDLNRMFGSRTVLNHLAMFLNFKMSTT